MRPRKAPTTLRETFDHFQFYRRELEESGLLIDVDFDQCHSRQVFYACHGRAPTSVKESLAHQRFSARELFLAALSSLEFQNKVVARLLAAYPEKSRLIFVHIPKSAGSDLSTHLIGRFASLNTKITDPSITGIPELHGALKDVTLEILASDRIYIHGHTHLQTYVDWGALRYGDEIFTTIRHPVDQIISQINYVLTRTFSTESPIPHDTRGWRDEFKISNVSDENDPKKILALASEILRNKGVVPENVICRYIGNGSFERAVECVAIHNMEVTDLEHYHSWIDARWGIKNKTRMNESKKYISLSTLSDQDRSYITSITNEDQKFFNLVQSRLKELGKPSLIGLEILNQETP